MVPTPQRYDRPTAGEGTAVNLPSGVWARAPMPAGPRRAPMPAPVLTMMVRSGFLAAATFLADAGLPMDPQHAARMDEAWRAFMVSRGDVFLDPEIGWRPYTAPRRLRRARW